MLKELKIDALLLVYKEARHIISTIGEVRGEGRLIDLWLLSESIEDAPTLGSVFAELYEAGVELEQNLCIKWGYLL